MTTKKLIEEVITTLVTEEALPIIHYLRGKTRISEFIIAEELDLEIHRTRNLLYRLLEHNIVYFHRKKDKIKGWYICYWDFNEQIIPHLKEKIIKEKLDHLRERLTREESGQFYLCRNACARMDFEKSIEFNFKCPECGEIMNQQDNQRTIQFLQERIKELEAEEEPPAPAKPEKTAKKTNKTQNVAKKATKTVKKTTKRKTAKKKTVRKQTAKV